MSNFKEKQLQLYGHSITDLQTQMTSRNVAHSALPLSSSKLPSRVLVVWALTLQLP